MVPDQEPGSAPTGHARTATVRPTRGQSTQASSANPSDPQRAQATASTSAAGAQHPTTDPAPDDWLLQATISTPPTVDPAGSTYVTAQETVISNFSVAEALAHLTTDSMIDRAFARLPDGPD